MFERKHFITKELENLARSICLCASEGEGG